MWFYFRKRDLLWELVRNVFTREKKSMNTDKFPFKRTFKFNGKDFSATYAAEEYLKAHGFTVGSMCFNEPRGIKKGQGIWIHKWRNLSIQDKDMLDGVMTSEDPRGGDVIIHLYSNPE